MALLHIVGGNTFVSAGNTHSEELLSSQEDTWLATFQYFEICSRNPDSHFVTISTHTIIKILKVPTGTSLGTLALVDVPEKGCGNWHGYENEGCYNQP